jgi:peptide deformylase
MIYPIVAYGDSVLRKVAVDIKKGDLDLEELKNNMYETMYEANGVGLAAPQIGKSIRVFIVDGEPIDDESLKGFKKMFINPQILEQSGDEWGYEEGCLSIPGIRKEVMRPAKLKIKYVDENFKEHIEEYDGIKARIIQHEYDHLEGILFVDLISPLQKQLIKNKLVNISRGKATADYRIKFAK